MAPFQRPYHLGSPKPDLPIRHIPMIFLHKSIAPLFLLLLFLVYRFLYPKILTFDSGNQWMSERTTCCESLDKFTFETIPENNLITWIVGLTSNGSPINIGKDRSFYKAINIKDKKYTRIKIETFPSTQRIGSLNLHKLLPTSTFLDKNLNIISSSGWESYRFNGSGLIQNYEKELQIPVDAKFLLIHSESRHKNGDNSFMYPDKIITLGISGYQKYNNNIAIGTGVIKWLYPG